MIIRLFTARFEHHRSKCFKLLSCLDYCRIEFLH